MTDPINGLSSQEVERLKAQGLNNESVGNQSKTVGKIVKDNIFTFFNFIFFFFAFLLITAQAYVNLTFLIIVAINTAIGIIQELKSKQVLDNLKMLDEPKTVVVRDGKILTIATEDLVRDDVCIFATGNQIGADAVVVSGSVKVNESLVTGESDEIYKNEGDELLSGSFVISGECRAQLTKVGAESYISKLSIEAKGQTKKKQTEMMRSLTKLLRIISFAMAPIGIIMFMQDRLVLNLTYSETVNAVVAALVGMIPEGLYLLTSMRLAASATTLGMKKVLVHEMNSIETLARVDTLCLDKTGTLTENKMAFSELIALNGFNEKPGEATLEELVEIFTANMNSDNVTIETLKEVFNKPVSEKAKTIYPFTSTVKYSAATFDNYSLVLGAPEKLLLSEYSNYKDEIESYMNTGNRVLLFGRLPASPTIIEDGKPLTIPVEPLGLVLLTNPVRSTAKETMDYFQNQSVHIKVISGDNTATVAAVAKKAGIDGADKVIDASTLTTMEEIKVAVNKYNVFGRVLPAQKKMLVQALQDEGHVVAMTGDGVNDVLALKTADCSIAMGQAADVVENVSQIVLLDSDFSKMPNVVAEGRQVVNNIQRSASLFLVKNIFSIFTAIFTIFTFTRFPLYTTQLSFYSLVVVGIPSFFLAMQPSNELIKGNFISSVLKKALPAAIAEFIMVQLGIFIGVITGMSYNERTTMAIIIMLIIGIIFLIHISQPLDKIRKAIIGLTIFCVTGGIIFFKPMFSLAILQGWQIAWTIVLSFIGVFIFSIILQFEKQIFITARLPRNNKYWLSRMVYFFKDISIKRSKKKK